MLWLRSCIDDDIIWLECHQNKGIFASSVTNDCQIIELDNDTTKKSVCNVPYMSQSLQSSLYTLGCIKLLKFITFVPFLVY